MVGHVFTIRHVPDNRFVGIVPRHNFRQEATTVFGFRKASEAFIVLQKLHLMPLLSRKTPSTFVLPCELHNELTRPIRPLRIEQGTISIEAMEWQDADLFFAVNGVSLTIIDNVKTIHDDLHLNIEYELHGSVKPSMRVDYLNSLYQRCCITGLE